MQFRLPREHGTWGMFFIPFAVGWLAAGTTNARVLLLLIASAAIFLSRETLLYWWRARRRRTATGDSGRGLLVYAAIAVAFGSPLVTVYHLYLLIPLAVAGVAALAWTAESAVRRQGRSLLTEMAGVVSASMNAAAAHYAALGRSTSEALWLWALCGLYFASSIFYVKLRVQDAHGKTPRAVAAARMWCASYHAALLAALVVLVITRSLPLFAAVAFTPVLVRAFVQVLRPSRRLNLRRIGWLEVCYSIVFLALMVTGYFSVA